VQNSLADMVVVSRTLDDPWENLVRAREEDINLVLVNGAPRYGTKQLMEACGARQMTSVRVGEAERWIMLIDPKDENKPPEEQTAWSWEDALALLEKVREDPIAAVDAANAPNAIAGRIPSATGPDERPLLLELDMPAAPGVLAGPPPPGFRVNIQPIPSLCHDGNWRASIKDRGFHGGVLDGLDRFYPASS
jgi:hypothetical protein